jgi:hypothetical protein
VISSPVEKEFISRMENHLKSGVDFRRVAKETLRADLGQIPSEILIRQIGEASLSSPRLLARALSTIFGRGAVQLFSDITETIENPTAGVPQAASFKSIVDELELLQESDSERAWPAYLHDHRLPNDLQEYVK